MFDTIFLVYQERCSGEGEVKDADKSKVSRDILYISRKEEEELLY